MSKWMIQYVKGIAHVKMDDAKTLLFVNMSSHSNYSVSEPSNVTYGIPQEFQFILLGMYGVTCIIVIFGNGIVCFTTYKVHSFRTVTNFFIVSLAVTDIIMTVTCVPFTILSNLFFHYWPFGAFMCPVVGFIQLASVLLRSFMLVAMTCDRYHVARKPLKPRLLTKCRAKVLVAIISALSSLIALPTFLYSKITYMPYEPGSRGLCMETWPDDSIRSLYGVCIMMLQYFVPLLIMSVTYIHIGIIIWVKRTPGEANSARDARMALSKKKTIKMIIVVVIAYLLSWLPLHVITIFGDLDQSIFNENYVHMIWLASHWLAFSNSGVNPIIYYWMNSKFRQSFLYCARMMCFWRRRRSKSLSNQDSFGMLTCSKSKCNGKGYTQPETAVTVTLDPCSSPPLKRNALFAGNELKDDCDKCDRV